MNTVVAATLTGFLLASTADAQYVAPTIPQRGVAGTENPCAGSIVAIGWRVTDGMTVCAGDLVAVGWVGPSVMAVVNGSVRRRGNISVLEGVLFRGNAHAPRAQFFRIDCLREMFAIDAYGSIEPAKNSMRVADVSVPNKTSDADFTPLSDSIYEEGLRATACGRGHR